MGHTKTRLELESIHFRGWNFPVNGFVYSVPFSTEVKGMVQLYLYSFPGTYGLF